MPVRAPSQSYACAPTATSGSARVPASVPSRRNARSAIESKARWFVQRSRSLSLEPSPFGLNARAARATVLEPRLASPPSPNVSPSMPASMKVAFGAVAAATYGVVDAGAEGIAVAVAPEEDVGRGPRAGEPRRPRAAIGRDLDVEAPDGRIVGGPPAHDESGVARPGHHDDDARLRRRRVVEVLQGDRAVQLRAGAVVAERPDPGSAQAAPDDEVVARLERLGVVEVHLAPRGDAAV